MRNLANDPAFADTQSELRRRMMAMLRSEQDPRALGKGEVFDTYKYVGSRAKGYETWLKAQESRLKDVGKEGRRNK